MTYWKELIDIPEHRSTFVLKLTEGLNQAQDTVDKYVVTPSLAERFDQALSLIDKAVRSGQSQGAFLHGSFGSGKSHFMAVLDLLLDGFGPARSIEALTDVVVKHNWMKERKFLMVPYHMLGATSMEQAVLGGYVDYIEEHHPGERLPGVFVADRILDNAASLRSKMGDDKFFEVLNGEESASAADGGGGGAWGDLETGWSAQSYEEALEAGPRSEQREKLVGDLVTNLLESVRDTARVGGAEQFVTFDEGLSIISRHAKELGYDGLILFLDELILWLSGKGADVEFLQDEVAKVPKLVEAQHAERPIPIVSFVARQRDLREMLGDTMIGEERNRLGLSLEWWKGRFDKIELEDRNLPVIASERLLKPKDKMADERIRQTFDKFVSGLKSKSRDIMLTTQHDEADFELVYPFSPALVQALIVLSSTLQRDRTALKLMQTLLIRQRDRLELGDIIPVGDLWDVIAEGDEPMNDFMRRMMRTARRLWEQKLHPMLVHQHGIDPDELRLGQVDPEIDDQDIKQFYNDARLLKTLLIAALVPKLEIFEDLTVDRLLALNHGTVRAPIPGAERTMAMKKLRNWASEVTEIAIQGTANPTVSVRLEDVDIEPLLKQADSVDSRGNRRRKVKELLYDWFGLQENRSLRAQYTLEWRGAKRSVEVTYGNIREMTFDRLESDGERWLLVFDYPFDEGEYTPAYDRAKLDEYRQEREESDTIAWLPSFLNANGSQLLGRLIKIEDVLQRFDEYGTNLRPEDRPIARTMLENNKKAVSDRLEIALHAAYGLSSDESDLLDASTSIDDHLHVLRHNEQLKLPYGKEFPNALEDIVREALALKYPEAYRIPDDAITTGRVRKMYDVIQSAIQTEDGRVFVEGGNMRRMLGDYAERLKLGIMGETHFVYKKDWSERIEQALQPGNDSVTVGDIYALLDPTDAPTGMPHLLKDLIVLAYADMEDRLVSRRGEEIDGDIGSLKPDDVLEQRRLPDDDAWESARTLAESVFGFDAPRVKTARNVEHVAKQLRESVSTKTVSARQIAERLRQVSTQYMGMDRAEVEQTRRWRVAQMMSDLLDALAKRDATELIETLTNVDVGEHDYKAIQVSLDRASDNLNILNQTRWEVFENVVQQSEPDEVLTNLLDDAREILATAEHAQPLTDLRIKERKLIELAMAQKPTPPKPVGTVAAPAKAEMFNADDHDSAQSWLVEQLKQFAGKKVTISLKVEDDG